MLIVFETHAITDDNEADVVTGWRPGRLSAAGKLSAKALGNRRRNESYEAVYCSDLGRAVETAQVAFGDADQAVFLDWRLRECDFGSWTGLSRTFVESCRLEFIETPYPDGESWRQSIERVKLFLIELQATRRHDRLLVIGHMATWLALEEHFRDRRLEDMLTSERTWQPGWYYIG